MKLILLAPLALVAATTLASGQDKIYLPDQDLTCYKVQDGEHSAHLDCKPGHLDNAPAVSPPALSLLLYPPSCLSPHRSLHWT